MQTRRGVKRKGAISREGTRPETASEVGVVLTDYSFRIIAMDRGAASILFPLFEEEKRREDPLFGSELPPRILEWMRFRDGGNAGSKTIRFRAGGRVYKGRSYIVESEGQMLPQSAVVLYLERETEVEDAILQVGLQYRLTDREQEALRGLANGLTSKELAERMGIRPSTVKTFLRLIMIKMGASNRASVVAKILAASRQTEGEATPITRGAKPEN
jgi:DNA-binding CsgD family transcriptional regulator